MKRVIFIITFSPKYEEHGNKPKPPNNWTTASGNWVGIWGGDWGDILLKSLVDLDSDFDCEIWQPDLRADIIYTAHLRDRLVHRNFPALMKKRLRRNRIVREISSDSIVEQVKVIDAKDTVFMVPVSLYSSWLNKIVVSIKASRILYYNFLSSDLMMPTPIKIRNPLKVLNRLLMNGEKAQWLSRVKNLLTMNDNPETLLQLKRLYPKMTIFDFMWGYDLEYWKPVMSKVSARESLGIPSTSFVIVLSQRLVPEYQVDKFIEVMSRIQVNRDFICYITGRGLQDYEAYLQDILKIVKMESKIKFVGYVDDEDLRKYFIAADLFVNLPITTAGSASALKATMVGAPVLQVPIGALYEFFQKYDMGEAVDPRDYDSWVIKLEQIIEGKQIAVPTRKMVEDHFSWDANVKDIAYAINNAK